MCESSQVVGIWVLEWLLCCALGAFGSVPPQRIDYSNLSLL